MMVLARYKNAFPGEEGLVLRALEDRGDRLLVESLVGLPINPTTVVRTIDVEAVPFHRFSVDGSGLYFGWLMPGNWNGFANAVFQAKEAFRLAKEHDSDVDGCKEIGMGLLDMSGFCLRDEGKVQE